MGKELRPAPNALRPWAKQKNNPGCGLAGLRHAHGVREIGGSNPPSPTKGKNALLGRFFILYIATMVIFFFLPLS